MKMQHQHLYFANKHEITVILYFFNLTLEWISRPPTIARTNLQIVAPCVQNVLHLANVLVCDKHLRYDRHLMVWAA